MRYERKTKEMTQVGTARTKSGKTLPLYLKRGPSRPAPKFKKTNNKGKGLAQAHYQKLVGSARGKPSARRFTSAGGTTMVGHDFVGTLVVTDAAAEADLVMSVSVNPVDLGFPALAIESQLHQQYIFEAFAIHMVNSGTEFLTGDMLGYYDRDPDEELPPGIEGIQVGFFKGGTSAAFKDGHVWHMPQFPGLPVLYSRDLSSDERLVNQCQFNLMVVNPPSVFNGSSAEAVELPVEFWASYKCKFLVKDIAFNPQSQFPRNHITNNGEGGTATFEGKTYGGVYMLACTSDGKVNDNVTWIKNLSDFGVGCTALPGMFWGFRNATSGPVLGMLSGYGFNKAMRFSVHWRSTKASKLASLGIDPDYLALCENCTVDASYADVCPYTATADAGTYNTQVSHVWNVIVNNPGQVQTPNWSSNDRLYYVTHEGTVELMPYDSTREAIWLMTPGSNDTGTATLAMTSDTQRVDVHLEQYEGFGLLSPAVTPGPATIEGLVKQKFASMSNQERCKYEGQWQKYLAHVRELRRPKPKPLPDYLKLSLLPEAKKETELKELPQPQSLRSAIERLVLVDDDEQEEKERAQPATPAGSRSGSVKSTRSQGRLR